MLYKGQDLFDCVSCCFHHDPKSGMWVLFDLFDHLDDIPESGEFWGWVTDESSRRATDVRKVETPNIRFDLDLKDRDSLG